MREVFAPETWRADATQLLEARRRWMRAGYSALFRCVEAPDVGIGQFLDMGDKTQRELVARTATELYSTELGLEGDNLETFMGVTNVGVVGAGFDYEVLRWLRDDSISCEQYRCPLIDHADAAGYTIGHPALADMSLWCDMYDNFESAASAPSTAMVHSHCMGRGDHQCRWYIEAIDEDKRRGKDEHIYNYLARMRDSYHAADPGGPWVIDGMTPAEIDQATRKNTEGAEIQQSELFPTLEDKLEQGVLVSIRIGSSSVLIAGALLGWDRLIEGMAEKEGPILKREARAKANTAGIYGSTPIAAAYLHEALILGSGFGPYEITEESETRVVGSCAHCPLIEAGIESGLKNQCEQVMPYCSAAATYEAQALDDDLTQRFTHCIGRGDSQCRYVVEKQTA